MSRVEVTDANSYLGKWPYWNMEVNTGGQLVRYLKANGIDRALVSSLRSTFADTEQGNLELLKASKAHPKVIFGLATLTPLSKDKGAGTQALKDGVFKGIRLCPQYHGYSLGEASAVADLAEELGVPVVLAYRMILSWNLPSISMGDVFAFAEANPKVSVVLSGANYEAISILYRKKPPSNLFVETSCLQMWEGKELLLEHIGTSKVLLGTGGPVQYARSGVSNVVDSTLPDKEKEMVASSNARKLFGL